MTVDDIDQRVLFKLQRNGRTTNQDLAETLGLSNSSCWRRVKALEDTGVITGYAALIDRERAGFGFSAILHVALERHEGRFVEEFVARVVARPEVLDCFATTGDADYHLRVVVADLAAYNAFLDGFIFRLPGIRHVRSNVVLKEIKNSVVLPFSGTGLGSAGDHR